MVAGSTYLLRWSGVQREGQLVASCAHRAHTSGVYRWATIILVLLSLYGLSTNCVRGGHRGQMVNCECVSLLARIEAVRSLRDRHLMGVHLVTATVLIAVRDCHHTNLRLLGVAFDTRVEVHFGLFSANLRLLVGHKTRLRRVHKAHLLG